MPQGESRRRAELDVRIGDSHGTVRAARRIPPFSTRPLPPAALDSLSSRSFSPFRTLDFGPRTFLARTWAVFRTDLRLELRRRVALSSLLVFALATVMTAYFALGGVRPEPRVQAALLWIVMLFAASVGLGRAFVGEVERGTDVLLRLHATPGAVYAGKLLFTLVLTLALGAVASLAFLVVLGVQVDAPGLFALVVVLGGAGLAGATTLLSALVARAQGGVTLLPVLLFPLLVPVLLSAVRLTRAALAGGPGWTGAADGLTTLGAFAVVVVAAAVLLFEYVWHE
jgi:heme exporter protein B